MPQTIDPIKLKAAAEHLEWVLRQYPDDADVQGMLHGLMPLIEAAKLGAIERVLDIQDVPYNWAVNSEGLYDDFRNPSVRGAYVRFQIELQGGLTEQDERINARIAAMKASLIGGQGHG